MSAATPSLRRRVLRSMSRCGLDGTFLAILASLLGATLGVNAMPMLVGSISDNLHVNAADAGMLATYELAAVAFSCLLLASRVSRVSRHALGLAGAAIAAAGHGGVLAIPALAALPGAGHVATLDGQGLSALYLFVASTRVLAGIGEGLMLAAFGAGVASTRDPDGVYARALIASVSLIGLAMATLVPQLTARFSYVGTFCALALLTLACMPFMRGLPHSGATETRPDAPVRNRSHGVLLVTSFAIFALGEGASWSFAERIGVGAGLSYQRAGLLIGLASTLGVFAGAGASMLVGQRFGRRRPLFLGLAAFGTCTVLLVHTANAVEFTACVFMSIAALYFLLPCYVGAASALDPLGRWSSAAAGMYLMGNAAGPLLAGRLITSTRAFDSVGWLVASTCALAIVLMRPVMAVLDDEASAVPPERDRTRRADTPARAP
jgi:MFS family permease